MFETGNVSRSWQVRLISIGLCIISTACSSSGDPIGRTGQDDTKQRAVQPSSSSWERAPDDSLFTFKPLTESSHYGKVARCWKKTAVYDCLYVGEIPVESEMGSAVYSAYRFQSVKPEDEIANINVSGGGYGCQFFSGPKLATEILSSSKGTVDSNTVDLTGPRSRFKPWNSDDKIKRLKTYGSPADTQFDCVALAGLVMDTSLAAITGNEVTFTQMMH